MASSGSNASLLAAAVTYAIGCVSNVTPGVLSWHTPCAGWDVVMLLRHLNDSLTAVHEGSAQARSAPSPLIRALSIGDKNSWASICLLDAPAAASRTTCSSCGVSRASGSSAVTAGAPAPAARNSASARHSADAEAVPVLGRRRRCHPWRPTKSPDRPHG